MLCEAGVTYTSDADEAEKDFYLMPYTIKWYNVTKGEQGETTIFCSSKLDALTLVNCWNKLGMLTNKYLWVYTLG